MINQILPMINAAATVLLEAGCNEARLDSELLLCHQLGWSGRDQIYLNQDFDIPNEQALAFKGLVERRAKGEPIAHIRGYQEFWSLSFKVTKDTLIPRADTETLVQTVLDRCSSDVEGAILDLGTGSGCILISLLSECTNAMGVGVDKSQNALKIATENSFNLGFGDRTDFYVSDWLDDVPRIDGGYDIVVSNPPYIPRGDMAGLMRDVRDYEPSSALEAGDDGLDDYRKLLDQVPRVLKPNGFFAVEVGFDQAEVVSDLFIEAGFDQVRQSCDMSNIERIVSGFLR